MLYLGSDLSIYFQYWKMSINGITFVSLLFIKMLIYFRGKIQLTQYITYCSSTNSKNHFVMRAKCLF